MDYRQVKPYFWPVMAVACVAFAVMIFYLIGGMISNRTVAFTIGRFNVPGEDYFIAALAGLILFLVANTVRKNALETPKMAVALMFGSILLAALAVWVMNRALTVTDHVNFAHFQGNNHAFLGHLGYLHPWRGLDQLGTYRELVNIATTPRDAGGWEFPRSHIAIVTLNRAIHLSYGIIAGLIFISLQAVTCFLMFFRTMPAKRALRH